MESQADLARRLKETLADSVPHNGFAPNAAIVPLLRKQAADDHVTPSRTAALLHSLAPSVGAYIDVTAAGDAFAASACFDATAPARDLVPGDIGIQARIHKEAFEWLGPQSDSDIRAVEAWAAKIEDAYAEMAVLATAFRSALDSDTCGPEPSFLRCCVPHSVIRAVAASAEEFVHAIDTKPFSSDPAGVIRFPTGARYPALWNGPRWKEDGFFSVEELIEWARSLPDSISAAADVSQVIETVKEGPIAGILARRTFSAKIGLHAASELDDSPDAAVALTVLPN